jgi:hypothetical protein
MNFKNIKEFSILFGWSTLNHQTTILFSPFAWRGFNKFLTANHNTLNRKYNIGLIEIHQLWFQEEQP